MCLLNIETSAGKSCGYLTGGDSGVRSYYMEKAKHVRWLLICPADRTGLKIKHAGSVPCGRLPGNKGS